MADPTIQTFCCHHVTAMTKMAGDNLDKAVDLLKEFNSTSYNIVCMVSATIGMLGAIYQILPRELPTQHQNSLQISRGREIIVWLAAADLMASIGVFFRSLSWLLLDKVMPDQNDTSSVMFCALSSAWTQYFYTCTWFWTLIYAIDMKRSLCGKLPSTKYYHLTCWLVPAILTLVGLSVLYIPDADCHSLSNINTVLTRILPNYFATYLPIAMVMIVNPFLYKSVSKDVTRVVIMTSGQITIKERKFVASIKLKFMSINMVFYICWLPNLINGILLWTLWCNLPLNIIVVLWYIMAVTNPLQAFLNALVYRRKRGGNKIKLPCRRERSSQERHLVAPGETTPLMHSSGASVASAQHYNTDTRRSVNNVCSYL